MSKSQSNFELARINAEGELVGGKFCEYCGGLNRADAADCEHCHEHIADQGPDLSARLQRIRRRASSADELCDIADEGIGSSVAIKRFIELGAVGASYLFLIFMVILLSAPTQAILFMVMFFGIAALSCTAVRVMIDFRQRPADQREGRDITGSTGGFQSAPVRWDAIRLISRITSMMFDNTRSPTVATTIIVFVIVLLVLSLVMLPLAR